MKLVLVVVVLTAALRAYCRDIPDGQPVLLDLASDDQKCDDQKCDDQKCDDQNIQNGLEVSDGDIGTTSRCTQSRTGSESTDGHEGDLGEAVEGFLCPTCYTSFTDPEQLQEVKERSNIELCGKNDKEIMKQLQTKFTNLTNTSKNLTVDMNILTMLLYNIEVKMELQNILSKLESIDNSNSEIKADISSMKQNLSNANSIVLSKLESITANQGTIDTRFDNLEMELQSLKVNMDNSSSNLNSELQFLKDNMTNSDANLNSEIQSIKVNINYSNTNLSTQISSMNSSLNTKLASLAENQDCPRRSGFFWFNPSSKCFKYLNDARRNWYEAKAQCELLGLQFAKLNNPAAVLNYMVSALGSTNHVFLGARGAGSYFKWLQDGRPLSNTDPNWWSGTPGGSVTTNHCLSLVAHSGGVRTRRSYYPDRCTTRYYALCELV